MLRRAQAVSRNVSIDIRVPAVLKRTIRGFRHRTNSGVPPQDRYIDLSYHSKPKGSGLDKARRDRPGDAGCAEHADLDNVGICIDVQVADLVGFAGAACVSTPPGTVSPGFGMRLTVPIRSRLVEPRTVIT